MDLDGRIETCCKLYEEIEEYKKQIEAMKGKMAGADKAAFDMKKLKD